MVRHVVLFVSGWYCSFVVGVAGLFFWIAVLRGCDPVAFVVFHLVCSVLVMEFM